MGCTRAELRQRLTALEFLEWQAFDALSPIGPERFDILAGLLASVLANLQRDPRKRSQPFSAADFVPRWDRPEPDPEAQWQQQKAAMMALVKVGKRKDKMTG